jgi:hypothetical protein
VTSACLERLVLIESSFEAEMHALRAGLVASRLLFEHHTCLEVCLSRAYACAADVAASPDYCCRGVGCILGELWRHKTLLPGRSEPHQLELIALLLGAPNESIWPGFSSMPGAKRMNWPNQPYVKYVLLFSNNGCRCAVIVFGTQLFTIQVSRKSF